MRRLWLFNLRNSGTAVYLLLTQWKKKSFKIRIFTHTHTEYTVLDLDVDCIFRYTHTHTYIILIIVPAKQMVHSVIVTIDPFHSGFIVG